MATPITKDARNFVDGIVSYLKKDKHVTQVVPKVRALLGKVTAQAKKQKIAHIESAIQLSQTEKTLIEKTLVHHIGHDVELDCQINAEVLGGIRIQIGDWIIDTSLKSQLEQMATVLI